MSFIHVWRHICLSLNVSDIKVEITLILTTKTGNVYHTIYLTTVLSLNDAVDKNLLAVNE